MEKLVKNTGPYFSDKMYFCKIWQSHEPARLGVIFYVPLWNLAGNLAAMWQRCLPNFGVIGKFHYNDVIMSAMASQITGISVVCSTVGLGADQRKHQHFTSLAFVWGIRWPVNSPHKRPVTRKIFPFDDVIMFKCLSHPSSKILQSYHDDGIKWKPFPHCWPFVRRIHQSPVNSTHKGQWGGALMFYLLCAWINVSVNNHEAGNLSQHRAHYDVTEMYCWVLRSFQMFNKGPGNIWNECVKLKSNLCIGPVNIFQVFYTEVDIRKATSPRSSTSENSGGPMKTFTVPVLLSGKKFL